MRHWSPKNNSYIHLLCFEIHQLHSSSHVTSHNEDFSNSLKKHVKISQSGFLNDLTTWVGKTERFSITHGSYRKPDYNKLGYSIWKKIFKWSISWFKPFPMYLYAIHTNKKWPKKKIKICWWAHEAGVTFDILVEVHCNEWIIGYRLMLVIHKSLQIVWCYVVLVL